MTTFTSTILLAAFFITLIVTSIGFKKTVWFISIGYTMAIALLSVLIIVFHYRDIEIYNYLQLVLLLIWGGRLGYYIIKRESSASYNESVKSQTDSSQALPLIARSGIWLSVSFLYVCMFSPAVYTLQKTDALSTVKTIILASGLIIMASGIAIETIADNQKSDFKRLYPKSFCNTGLYKWVRCPNYLGEIMVWTGNFICAIAFLAVWWQWATAVVGLVAIVLIMIGSAKRLEKKHKENYGSDPEFQKYEKSVPILFPWVKIYTLQNVKVYLE